VQAYAALAFLTLSVFLLVWLPNRRQPGDVAGLCCWAGGAIFLTEFWRDTEGAARRCEGAGRAAVGGRTLVVAGGLR